MADAMAVGVIAPSVNRETACPINHLTAGRVLGKGQEWAKVQ
jgi:hypothetical protein